MRGWSGFPASSNARSKTGPGAQSYGPRPRESKPMLVASTVGTLAGISVPVGRPAAHRQGSGGTWLEPRRWRRGGPVQAGDLWTGTCPVDDAGAVAAVRPTVPACLHTPARP